ncbi:hypothetical protein BDV97DRAFT_358181 [Delphinella strobiligena]|nr:hypothetical protein BDV97DRAFT_358181 [Delphinella strobiligena]
MTPEQMCSDSPSLNGTILNTTSRTSRATQGHRRFSLSGTRAKISDIMLHRGSSTSISGSLNGTTTSDNSRSSTQHDWHTDPVSIEPESSQMDIDDVPCDPKTVLMPANHSVPQAQRRRSSSYNGRQSSSSGFRNSRAITFNSSDRRVQYKSFRSLRSVRPSRRLAAEWGEAHPRLYGHQNPGEMPDSNWEYMDLDDDDRAPLTPLPIPPNNMFHHNPKTELSPETMFEQISMNAGPSANTTTCDVNDEQGSDPMCLETSWDFVEQGQEIGRARAESLIRELSEEHGNAQDSSAHDKDNRHILNQSIEHSEKFPAYEDPLAILGWRPPEFTLQPHFSAEHIVPSTSSDPYYDAHGIPTGLCPSLWALRPASPPSATSVSAGDDPMQGWEMGLQPWVQGPPSPIREEPESPRGTVLTATRSLSVPQPSISTTTSYDTGEGHPMQPHQARNYQGRAPGQVPTANLRIPDDAFVAKVLQLDSPDASTIMRNRQSSVAKFGLESAMCRTAQVDEESNTRRRTTGGHRFSAASAYLDEYSQDWDDPRTVRRPSTYSTGGSKFRKDSQYSAPDTFELDKDRYTYNEPLHTAEELQASFMPKTVIASEEEDHDGITSRFEVLPLLTASFHQATIVTQAGKVAQARRRSRVLPEEQSRNNELQDHVATIMAPGRRSTQDMPSTKSGKAEKLPPSTVDLAIGETYVAALGESAAYSGCNETLDVGLRPSPREALVQNLFRSQLDPLSDTTSCLGREISLKEVPKDVIPIRTLPQLAEPIPLANDFSPPASPAPRGPILMNEEATHPTHLGSLYPGTPLEAYTPVSSNIKTPVPSRNHDSPEYSSILDPEAYCIHEMGSSAQIHTRTCERLRMQILTGEICKSRLSVFEQGRRMSGKAKEGAVRVGKAFCGGFVDAARSVGGLGDFWWGNEIPETDIVMEGERDRWQRGGERGLWDSGLVHAAGYI